MQSWKVSTLLLNYVWWRIIFTTEYDKNGSNEMQFLLLFQLWNHTHMEEQNYWEEHDFWLNSFGLALASGHAFTYIKHTPVQKARVWCLLRIVSNFRGIFSAYWAINTGSTKPH